MFHHSNHFPNDLIENAVSHVWDSHRSHSENLSLMENYLSQFTGPLSRDEQMALEFSLTDEIKRHQSFNPLDI